MMKINTCSILLFSAILRVLLIIFGEWQDTHMEVRYTDVDYLVFSDAASLMASGRSPYERSTYRYSPLLAFLLTPNHFFHHSWGKLLFSSSDILVGWLIRSILKLRGVPKNMYRYSVVAWLLNPFTFTIGTRGNCEPVVSAMILWVIFCILKGKIIQAAFWYGLVVHFRIYPIIYALPILLILDPPYLKPEPQKFLKTLFPMLFTRQRIVFLLVSGGSFFFSTGFSFYLYRWEFLHEALLYHLGRTDPRHNFSIYFYYIYLRSEQEISLIEKLISFLPQLLVQLVLIFRFASDLPFCFFVQTVAFVALNKVITAQYFVWFFCLLPLILPWSKMKLNNQGLTCIATWVGAEVHWLLWAYLLEFKGRPVFLQVWIASIVFLAANTYVLSTIICHHNYSPIFEKGTRIRSSCFKESTVCH